MTISKLIGSTEEGRHGATIAGTGPALPRNQSSMLAGETEVKGRLPADNGPYRGGKGSLYEGGARVVSLINWPGKIKPGTVVDEMIHVVDYYPTLP